VIRISINQNFHLKFFNSVKSRATGFCRKIFHHDVADLSRNTAMQKYEMMISIIGVSFKTNGMDKAYMSR